MSSQQPQVCPKCRNPTVPGAKFCGVCATPLTSLTQQPPAPPPEPQITLPLFGPSLRITEENARAIGEANKVALFGLASKRAMFGKKPEEYIMLERIARMHRVYVLVHGVYSTTYVIDAAFPLNVGNDTVEIEVAGQYNKFTPAGGVVNLPTKLRKVYRKEGTVIYDERADEINQGVLSGVSSLSPMQFIPPPLGIEDLQKLMETSLDLAKGVLRFRIISGNSVASGNIEKESLDLSDSKIVLLPYYAVTFVNSKTGERKNITIDGISGALS